MSEHRVGLSSVSGEIVNYRSISESDDIYFAGGVGINWEWQTYEGLETQKEFVVSIRYKGWMRGVSSETTWSSVRTVTIPADQCSPVFSRNGMWKWFHNMDIGGMLQEISGGRWRYDCRTYDRIDLEIMITANHTDRYIEAGGPESTMLPSNIVTIEYIPTYYLRDMYYETSDYIVVEYGTTWERRNDRFNVPSILALVGAKYVDVLKEYWFWDTVEWSEDNKRLRIPTSILRQHIKGLNVIITIGFNANYRISGDHIEDVTQLLTCRDHTVCNPVIITANVIDGVVYVHTKLPRANNTPDPKQATIKLVGGEYSLDQQTVKIGETAVFPYCPFNTELVFECVGSAYDGYATSEVTTCRVPPIMSDLNRLDAMATSTYKNLQWRASDDDAGPTITSRGNSEVVDLARGYPSAFYGRGGQKTISYNAVLIDDYGLDIENFPQEGDMMLRFPNSRRYPFVGELKIIEQTKRITRIQLSGDVTSG